MEKNLDKLAELLKDDDLRRDVIKFLAREHAKDFLVPVRVNFDGETIVPVSCKEWQE